MTTQCPWTRILTSEPRFDWDVSDRGRRRQGKLLFKKWICVFSTFIAIIPTHLYCREKSMRTLLELNSYEPYSSSRKKKCDARAKLFFCLLNLLVFWSSCCRIAVLPTGGHFACACVNMGCWSAIEAFSVNCLRSVPAFAGCFLELNDVYWVLRSSDVFFKVSWYFFTMKVSLL